MTHERGDNNTLRQSRVAAHLLGCSLREGLDNIRRSWKRLKRRPTEAASCHVDDMSFSREWPHFTEVASSIYCDRTASSCSSNLVDHACHPGMHAQTSWLAALISFPDAELVVGYCEGAMYTNMPIVLGPWRFNEPTYISPLTWYISWSPQRCGARRNR